MRRTFHICRLSIWYSFATLIVLVAALFSIARILLPQLSQYSVDIERYATAAVGQPLKIQSLAAEWHGLGPSLVLNNVRLLSKDGEQTIAHFSKVQIGLGVIESLRLGQLSFRDLVFSGADLFFLRHEDGRLTLAGFERGEAMAAASGGTDFLSTWLLGQGHLSLALNNLIYEDRTRSGSRHHFSNVLLSLRNQGDRHMIDAVLGVAGQQTQKMRIAMDVRGDVLQSGAWSGQIYAKATVFEFDRLLSSLDLGEWRFGLGPVDLEAWGVVEQGGLREIRGELRAKDLLFSRLAPCLNGTSADQGAVCVRDPKQPTRRVAFDELSGRFQFLRDAQHWRLNMDRMVLREGGTVPSAGALFIDYRKNGETPFISVASSQMRLEHLRLVSRLFVTDDEPIGQALAGLQPSGALRDVRAYWPGGLGEDFRLALSVEHLNTTPWDQIPGLQNISGTIVADRSRGYMALHTAGATVQWPNLFRGPLKVKALTGDLYWQKSADTWDLWARKIKLANDDIHAESLLDLHLPVANDAAPSVGLLARFYDGDGRQVSTYLPAKIMHSGTVAWLDRAIKAGYVPQGGVIFHGQPKDFPFRHGEGMFEIRFDVQDGALDYAETWPLIRDIGAEVVFRGSGMSINAETGKIFNSTLSATQVAIPDMAQSPILLTVQGQVDGKTSEKLRYLNSAPPLKRRFSKALQGLKVEGDSRLHLGLELHMGDELDATVKGRVTLNNNRLDIDGLGNVLSVLNGDLLLGPSGLSATMLKGKLLGQTSEITIQTEETAQDPKTQSRIQIGADGRFDIAALSKRFLPVAADLVKGESDWRIGLSIPVAKVGITEALPFNIEANSSSKGIEVRLPPPLQKAAGDELAVRVRATWRPGQGVILQTHYGGALDAVYEYKSVNALPTMRGELRFGGGPVALPEDQGLRLVGHLDTLDLDIWRSLLRQINREEGLPADSSRESSRAQVMDILHSTELNIDTLYAYGQTFNAVQLQSNNNGDHLTLEMNAKQLRGVLQVPANLQTDVVEMNLQYLRLADFDVQGGKAPDPRDLPALHIVCDEVQIKDRHFGALSLQTTKLANGLRLDQLKLSPRATEIQGYGEWTIRGEKQNSNFSFRVDSKDLGVTLEALGYVGNIKNGNGTVQADLSWAGPLVDVDMALIEGKVKAKLEAGRLLEVNTGGAGRRILGLLSLQTLPRRLFLDFSDLFTEGLSFDIIEGDFTLDRGDAFTRNLYLDGPGARVDTQGRIGLVQQDYDQVAKVTLHIADLTSFLALLTAATPLAIILPQVLKGGLDKVATFEYEVTGRWDDPKVELKKRPVAENSTGASDSL